MENQDQYIEDLKEKILDTVRQCRNCNYCYSGCPLFDSTRGFASQGPSGLMTSIYYGIRWNLLEGEDGEDLRGILYACTTCGNCEIRCKKSATNTPIVEVIENGRKLLLESMIGPLPEQRMVLESIYKYGNPYGESPENRLSWIGDLKVKLLPSEKAEVLYYVGCTASYEPKLHNLPRSIIHIFQRLGVDFGILEAEVCCGDPVRSLGDDVFFDEVINQNVEKFKVAGVKSIITTSPHCFNAFLKKYENMEKEFEVNHYTCFLEQAFEGRENLFQTQLPYTITYHDPCYLGKHNDIYDPPRALLKQIPGIKLVEMEMTKENSLCCGGGGGRMYAEVEEENSLAERRVRHALDAGADVIATACPWCHIMLDNAVQDLDMKDKIRVRDIAELLAEALGF
jgi:Fe-S oxidoreductase